MPAPASLKEQGAGGVGVGGFVCFSTVPGEVTAIPALFTETHSSV